MLSRPYPERWVNIETKETPTCVTLTVTDSGKNVDKNIINKFFEPFFTTKKVGEGTGLGLSITKGIIDEHKAKIEVKTQPTTSFTITFYKNKGINDAN